MRIDFYEIGEVNDKDLMFAVITSVFQDGWIYVRHEQRDTWEIPGGHRELEEDIMATAKRELFEETGAIDFTIKEICDYSVTKNNVTTYGRLFLSNISNMDNLPNLEIKERKLFYELPNQLTYPDIQPHLFEKAKEFRRNGNL